MSLLCKPLSLSLLLLTGVLAAKTTNDYQGYIRRRHLTSHNSTTEVHHRAFSAMLKVGVREDPNPGLTISVEEDNAAVASVESWFHDNSLVYYNQSSAGYDYMETTCQKADDEMMPSYNASDSENPYYFKVDCEVTFTQPVDDLTTTNTTSISRQHTSSSAAAIPSDLEVARLASIHYDVTTMVQDYWIPLMPLDSRFQTTSRIALNLIARRLPQEEDPATTTETPSTTTTTTQQTVYVVLEWKLGPPQDYLTIRQPTPNEYHLFAIQVHNWLTDTFTAAYNINNATADILPTFDAIEETVLESTHYDASSQPHTMVTASTVNFSNVTTPIPMWQWVLVLKGTQSSSLFADFVQVYLQDVPLFGTTTSISWRAIERF